MAHADHAPRVHAESTHELAHGLLVHALRERGGMSIWLDEDEMRGDVNKQMTDGIEDSACVI